MKTAAITGVRQAELVDRPQPSLREGWALVKVHAAPMCAEYKAFESGQASDCLGHEAAGEVIEAAPGSLVQAGDRVVVMPQYPCGACELCRAGDFIHCEHNLNHHEPTMTQLLTKPSWLLQPIPDGVSYEKASLACCGLGPSHGAFAAMGVDAFSTVLITGLGPVGLGAIVNAKFRGAKVIAVEMNEYRIDIARKMGADAIVDPRDPDALSRIKELTGGKGPDCGLECSGVVAAHRLQIDAVKRKGKVAFVGECFGETPIRVSDDLLRKGIQLIGSWHYNLREFPNLMTVIERSPILDLLVTHTYPMSRIQEALERSASQQCGKIILKPWE